MPSKRKKLKSNKTKAPQLNSSSNLTLFFGDLSYFCRDEHLQQLLHEHGFMFNSLRVMQRPDDPERPAYYSFITFANEEDLSRALMVFNGMLFQGRRLK